MNKKRLLKLAEFLYNIPPKKFDLETFVTVKNNKAPSIKEDSCNSTGCAIGYCPIVFPRLCEYDLSHVPPFGPDEYDASVMMKVNNDNFGDEINFEVGQALFAIDHNDVKYLFSPDHYHRSHRGPKSVAKRIRSFVERNGKVNRFTKAYEGQNNVC